MSYYPQQPVTYGAPAAGVYSSSLSKEEERRRKEAEEAQKKAEKAQSDRMAFAETLLKKVVLGKLMSYNYTKDTAVSNGMAVTDGDKVRNNALVFLAKEGAQARAVRNERPLQVWETLVYVPAIAVCGSIGAIAQRLAEKLYRNDNYAKTCAQHGLYNALLANLRSDFFISEANREGAVKIDSNLENIVTMQGDESGIVHLDKTLLHQFGERIFLLLDELRHTVNEATGTQVDKIRFNSDQTYANSNVGAISGAAVATTSQLSSIFARFAAGYSQTMSIQQWVSVKSSHEKPAAREMLNYGNLLHVARHIKVVDSFSFGKIPAKYQIKDGEKLLGYSFMPDLTNPNDAAKWSLSQILNVKYSAPEKKTSSRVKTGEIATKETFCRNLESRFLNYKQDQIEGLANGTKYLDPSLFVLSKGTGLDLKDQVETQKLFPNINITLASFDELRRLRDVGGEQSLPQRDQLVSTIVLACLKVGKRKFPVRGQQPSTEFIDIAGKVESVVSLLGVDRSVMQGMAREQIMAINHGYAR